MRNRIILIALAVFVWAGLKAIDDLVTGPELLFLLAALLFMMISHSVWLFGAQDEWQKKLAGTCVRRFADKCRAFEKF